MSLSVAANNAGCSPGAAAKVRSHPEVVARLGELQSKNATFTTMSVAAICCEVEKTATEARAEKQYKAALECYKLLHAIVTSPDSGLLNGLGQALPAAAKDRRAELTRRLRGDDSPPIHAEVEADGEEAAQ